jgi:predicted transcriptional regulator
MDYLISINPPYTDMIFIGEKGTEYRKQIISKMKVGDRLFIYETKNKGGIGKVIGCVNISDIFAPMYIKSDGVQNSNVSYLAKIAQGRYEAIKNEYLHWCKYKGIAPECDGWLDNPFIKHFEKIGGYDTNYNYAISLTEPYKFTNAFNINDFSNSQGVPFTRPPQNMCRCIPPVFLSTK